MDGGAWQATVDGVTKSWITTEQLTAHYTFLILSSRSITSRDISRNNITRE